MNRRKFLGFLAAAGAAIAVPELLVPKKSFFLPPAGGWKTYDLRNWNFGLDDFEERVLQPAMQRLSVQIDEQMCGLAKLQVGDIISIEPHHAFAPQKQYIITAAYP